MHWDVASSVLWLGVVRCFGSHNMHPHPGNSARVDQVPACVPVATHGSALFNQSHRVVFSVASLADWMALFLAAPVTPNRARTLQSKRPANPLQPTSAGSQNVLQPLPLHSSASSWCWVCFLSTASSIRSSQGAVSMLLQCAVGTSAAFPGQPAAANQRLCGKMPAVDFASAWGFSLALMKVTSFFGAWWCLLVS